MTNSVLSTCLAAEGIWAEPMRDSLAARLAGFPLCGIMRTPTFFRDAFKVGLAAVAAGFVLLRIVDLRARLRRASASVRINSASLTSFLACRACFFALRAASLASRRWRLAR